MSRENVELCRKNNDAFKRGDWDTVAANLDPRILVRPDPSWPERSIYGREAVVDWLRGVREVMGADMGIAEIKDLGDRVLIRFHWTPHGRHSGIEGELNWSEIVTVRGGRLAYQEMFFDHEQALKAVGLAE